MNVVAPFIKTIPSDVFSASKSMKHFYAPLLTRVERLGFSGCNGLYQIDACLENVAELAFSSCVAVGKLKIKNVKSIVQSTFRTCKALPVEVEQFIHCVENNQPKGWFGDFEFDAHYFASQYNKRPQFLRSEFDRSPWFADPRSSRFPNAFGGRVKVQQIRGFVSNTKQIPPSAFSCNRTLMFVVCPRLTVVEDHTFEQCFMLRRVKSPKLRIIRRSAFFNCVSLVKIDLQNVLELQSECFQYCHSIVTHYLPKLIKMDKDSYGHNGALIQVVCPELISDTSSLKIIGKSLCPDYRVIRHQEVLLDEFRERKRLIARISQIKQTSLMARRSKINQSQVQMMVIQELK